MADQAIYGQVLVLDVGTTRLRVSVVRADGTVKTCAEELLTVRAPFPGTFEFDASLMAKGVLELAHVTLSKVGPVDGVGITAQRASTIVWEKSTGVPIGPAIGWQDLRTTGQCLALQEKGLRLSPNQSATKATFLIGQYGKELNRADLAIGTVDSYCAYLLSANKLHVTDRSNAGVTGLLRSDGSDWDDEVLATLELERELLPKLVPSTGFVGEAAALESGLPLVGLCGDQQASLIGQGCVAKGQAKATFGTGAMVDCCVGERPGFEHRGPSGTFPIVAWQDHDEVSWGVEAIMLTAGSCIDWLCKGLKILESPTASDSIAGSVADTGGVVFVPALNGLGTPTWDFGARGALIGLSSSSTRAEIVRAVLEGIAQRGAELLDAIENDCKVAVETLSIDGGMSVNRTFVDLLANVTQRPIAVASVTEATTRGVGYLAGTAVGLWDSLRDAALTATTSAIVEPTRRLDRDRWRELSTRAEKTVPALSAITF